jgi:hypothetical protein
VDASAAWQQPSLNRTEVQAGSQNGGDMNFEVNGIPYLFTFNPSAARWCLLTSSGGGVESIVIHNDGTPLTTPILLTPFNGSAPQ